MYFFENTNFSLQEIYNALTYIEPYKESLQSYIYDHIQEQYRPNNECIFYDVTNYYFEIDDNDDFRKKGVNKEHRPNPIVQMGLFMDSLGLPMYYGLFPGNTNDCLTLKPMVQKLQKDYSVGKILESLSKCNCSNYHENYYLFDYYDTVLKDIGTILNINFALKNRTLQDIKNFIII